MLRRWLIGLLLLTPWSLAQGAESPLHLVVTDPLALPLSCECVAGYAQRRYEVLAEHLTKQLGRKVEVCFGETLAVALKRADIQVAHIVIGKDSVLRAGAQAKGWKVEPLGLLTGKDGATTQTGLVVVRSADPATKLADLAGYRILYGPPDCDEKFAAPRDMLSKAGITVVAAEQAEISAACSDGACKLIEWGDSERAAAVISSYAAPLLEGCGQVKPGDLRVVAETAPVPFVTAFATDQLDPELVEPLRQALLDLPSHPQVLEAIESALGFIEPDEAYLQRHPQAGDAAASTPAASTTEPAADNVGWTGFGGPTRNFRVGWLPTSLPARLPPIWSAELGRPGLGGLAATEQYVVLGSRNVTDTRDEWHCYDAATGALRWLVDFAGEGQLDYGNTPRATPVIDGDFVYVLGAFGHLACIELASGLVQWEVDFRDQFAATQEQVWGFCSTPVVVGDVLVTNPGADDASLVGLDKSTGIAVWQTPGSGAGHASLTVVTIAGREQVVTYDRTTLGGWDPATGERLWTYKPPQPGDFNVPTPQLVGDHLLVATEGNGARLLTFGAEGQPLRQPLVQFRGLKPDMSTPVVTAGRVFCVVGRLYCLDAANLQQQWVGRDDALGDYAALLASDTHLLTVGHGGELLLIDAQAPKLRVVSRAFLFDDPATRQTKLLSQPALVGTRLYVRGETSIACFELAE